MPCHINTMHCALTLSAVLCLACLWPVDPAFAQDSVTVQVNVDVRHIVNGENRFDRERFITLHSSHTDPDWEGGNSQSLGAPNASDDLMGEFLDGYDVYFGRDTGAMAWQLSQLPEDTQRRGFVDEAAAESRGGDIRWAYTTSETEHAQRVRQHQRRNRNLTVAAQQHPYWPDGKPTGQGWAFSTTDTTEEPLGTATGHFMGQYLKWYFQYDPDDPFGQVKPPLIEVMNEPLYELVTVAPDPEDPATIFEFHNTVAAEIRKTNPEVLVGGYCAAFPDFEKSNFERWEERDRLFIDMAGENMDFWSIHLYDFPVFQGPHPHQYRKGSNMEATFDMMDQYSMLRLGHIKPYAISEFGAQVHQYLFEPWTPYRDWLMLKSINSMLMAFLERPDRIAQVIPFIPVKAEWGRKSANVPYAYRLMRQAKEAEGESGEEWVYTDLVKFYRLWSEVRGSRVDTWADDPDILVDAYVDGRNLFLVVNNLEFEPRNLRFNLPGASKGGALESVHLKHLKLAGNEPVLEEQMLSKLPRTFELGAEATAIFKLRFAGKTRTQHKMVERILYATEYKKAIVQGTPLYFDVPGFNGAAHGEAVLRLGIGRDHGLSLQPVVNVNGQRLDVPTDIRGGDQFLEGDGRETFFGVLEIPVPHDILVADNLVEVNFPDSGGFVSSVLLQTFSSSRSIRRP